MSDPSSAKKLAQLEETIAAQDARSEANEAKHAKAMFEAVTELETKKISDALALDLAVLNARLTDLGLVPGDDEDEIEFGIVIGPSGEAAAAIVIQSITYWAAAGELVAQREQPGGVQWSRLGDDGAFGPWEDLPPSASTRGSN